MDVSPVSRDLTPRDLIAGDVQCICCAYPLRGMELASRCPECGADCVESLDELALADVDDIARLRSGLTKVFVAGAAGPLVFAALGLLSSLARAGVWTGVVAGATVCVVGPCLSWIGVYQFGTALRPYDATRVALPSSQWRATRAALACASGHSVCAMAGYGGALIIEFSRNHWRWLDSLISVAFWLAGICWVARNSVLCRRAGWIAGIAHGPRLRRMFAILRWIARVGTLVGILTGLVLLVDNVAERYFHGAVFNLQMGPLGFELSQPLSLVMNLLTIGGLLVGVVVMPVMMGLLLLKIRRAHARAMLRGRIAVVQSGNVPLPPEC